MSTALKELRKNQNMTQEETAKFLKISLRTYQTYESDASKTKTLKFDYMKQKLEELNFVDESHGILTQYEIEKVCTKVFSEYEIDFCFLFGSYAKNNATETSDIDLLISSELTGIKYFGLVERLSNELKKKVDLMNIDQVKDNKELLIEILKDGLKIYG